MATPTPGNVTRLLLESSAGDPGALDKLIPLVYEELRTLAARAIGRERPDHTLEATALVQGARAAPKRRGPFVLESKRAVLGGCTG